MFGVNCLQHIHFLQLLEDQTSHAFLQACKFIIEIASKFVSHSDVQLVQEPAEVDLTQQLLRQILLVVVYFSRLTWLSNLGMSVSIVDGLVGGGDEVFSFV